MATILYNDKEFTWTRYLGEEELEKAVVKNYQKIFGEYTYYFDLKKAIGEKKGLKTIPDGYLLKFPNPKFPNPRLPSLTIIENELAEHDSVKHIGVQLMKFKSASAAPAKFKIIKILADYLKKNPKEAKKIDQLLTPTKFQHYSELLNFVVMDQEIKLAIIIDKVTENLDTIRAAFKPQIILLRKFTEKNNHHDAIYYIEDPDANVAVFLDYGIPSPGGSNSKRDSRDIDTIVCPSKPDGLDTFLVESRWYQVKISEKNRPRIKYVALYESAPHSEIKYIGEVKEIKPYKDTGKYEIVLKNTPTKIKPIKLDKGAKLAPLSPKCTTKALIYGAKTLDDIFGKN